MTEQRRPHRWQRWLLLPILGLLLFLSCQVYEAWRPLTEVERSLLGTWVQHDEKGVAILEQTFTADRRVQLVSLLGAMRVPLTGADWKVQGSDLWIKLDLPRDESTGWQRVQNTLSRILTLSTYQRNNSAQLTVEENGAFQWGNSLFRRHGWHALQVLRKGVVRPRLSFL